MIKINRGNPPKNNKLDSGKDDALRGVAALVRNGQLKSKEFSKLWQNDEVKEFLHSSQDGKCCYCERKRDKKRESDVEHFRPKAKVAEAPTHKGYWWLAYEWENLLISCKNCNEEYKKSNFPLENESKRAYTKEDDIHKEKPFLINPLEEDPSQFIDYDLPSDSNPTMIKAIGKCSRGKKTIDLTGINSNEVMIGRASRFKYFKNVKLIYDLIENGGGDINSKKNILQDMVSKREEFSGFATFYFKKVGLLK